MIKAGKRIERIDLYGRLKISRKELQREVLRLIPRLQRSGLVYSKDHLMYLKDLVEAPEIDYYQVVRVVESIV